jgi:hypothetical protein
LCLDAEGLFLPELREEAVVEEVPPGGPVVTGLADAEVLVFDAVLVERIPEALDAHVEEAFFFRAALADEQVVHLVIGLRVVEEVAQGLLGRVVAGAEDAEVGEEVRDFRPTNIVWRPPIDSPEMARPWGLAMVL